MKFKVVFMFAVAISLSCSSAKKKEETTQTDLPKKLPAKCATDTELKSRLEDMPELLVRLGGDHKAIRSYRGRPQDFFQEGHPTECKPAFGAGSKSTKYECPQAFSLSLHLPTEVDTKNQPKTFHITLKLLSTQPESLFDFPIDGLNENGDELTGTSGEHVFYAKSVDNKHIYVEWNQADSNSAAGSEQNVLVKLEPSNAQQLRSHISLQGKGVCGK